MTNVRFLVTFFGHFCTDKLAASNAHNRLPQHSAASELPENPKRQVNKWQMLKLHQLKSSKWQMAEACKFLLLLLLK